LFKNHKIRLKNSTDKPVPEKEFVAKAIEIDRTMYQLSTDMPGIREHMDLVGGINLVKGDVIPLTRIAQTGNTVGVVAYEAWGTYANKHGSESSHIEIASGVPDGETSLLAANWTISNTFGGVLRHEIGHSLEKRTMREAWRAGMRTTTVSRVFARNKSTAAVQLSKYGSSSAEEYFAESFAAYSHPQYGSSRSNVRIDPGLEKAFDLVLKGKTS
jgi:hypothetical protein